jgi:glycogen synthase
MKVAFLTNEYPPHVYGGAGVHVEFLTRALAALPPEDSPEMEILCFGDQKEIRPGYQVQGFPTPPPFPSQNAAIGKTLDTLSRGLAMSGTLQYADVLHGHTWYSHFPGCLLKQLVQAPLILTTHSLEPHRPWKIEQLGNGYHASSWIEETAYRNADGVIAVSEAMRRDVHELYGVPFHRIAVIPNGIDVETYQPRRNPNVEAKYGIDPSQPVILFVGRITRQKGLSHFLRSIGRLPKQTQIVLCAGAPDTPEIAAEVAALVSEASKDPDRKVFWIPEMLDRESVIALYSRADLFVCPSVYEPFGIINLEAMACGTPVVASKVGGIPEAVEDGVTGILVPCPTQPKDLSEPIDPEGFSKGLAEAISQLIENASLRKSMGEAARKRVVEQFSWDRVARRTLTFYQEVRGRYDEEKKQSKT